MQLECDAAHRLAFAEVAPHQRRAVQAASVRRGHASHDDIAHRVFFVLGLIKESAVSAQAAKALACVQLRKGFLGEGAYVASSCRVAAVHSGVQNKKGASAGTASSG